ncbi:MAG: sulfatase-like hydrolase/transferase [Pirellulales bacterium]
MPVIFLVTAVASMLSPQAVRAQERSPRRPNILVVLCDDLGYGDLACYGNATIQTPHLDRLASQGVRFSQCYAAAPVCSPSRAGLLTGRIPNRVGVYDWIPAGSEVHLPRDEISVAALLKQAGYATAHVGKWHLCGKFNREAHPQPADHGFDHWFSTQNNAAPSHHNPRNFVRLGEPVGELEGYSSALVADEAIRWLDSRGDGGQAEKPFCLFVWFHEPHEPIASAEQYVELYPEASKRGEALYYGNVTQMDAAVGRLTSALDERGLAEQTLVWFTSDNGPETLNRYPSAWRSHGWPGELRGMKLHLYEGGIRVPGIVRWPGQVEAGQLSDEPICGVDLLPTLCEVAGVEPPDDRPIDGASILPVFQGQQLERETPLYWQYGRALGGPKIAMRTGDWKLLAHVPPADGPGGNAQVQSKAHYAGGEPQRYELYNLANDPRESLDLAEREPQRVRRLARRMRELADELRADGPAWPVPSESPE